MANSIGITPAMIVTLEKLWAEGLTAAQMAEPFVHAHPEYRGAITRNAIIGLVTRARDKGATLPMRNAPTKGEDGKRRVGRKSTYKYQSNKYDASRFRASPNLHTQTKSFNITRSKRGNMVPGPSHDKPDPGIKEFVDKSPMVYSNAVDMMALEQGMCRWPVEENDKPLRYCGAECVGRSSYCRRHQS